MAESLVGALRNRFREVLLWATDSDDLTQAQEVLSTDGAIHVQVSNAADYPAYGAFGVVDGPFDYEAVPVTTQTPLGVTGAAGDYLSHVNVPTGTSLVVIKDGATTVESWTIATGETSRKINARSREGAWSLTCTGGGATAYGIFT